MAGKKRERLSKRISSGIGVSEEALTGVPLIEICADSEVFVSGVRSLLGYDEQCVSLDTSIGKLTVSGSGLELGRFSETQLTIRGNLKHVDLGDDHD